MAQDDVLVLAMVLVMVSGGVRSVADRIVRRCRRSEE